MRCLRQGYKKTEVGAIPEDWEVKKLEEVATVIMGQSPNSNSYNEDEDGIPFFQGNAEFGRMYPTIKKWCNEPLKIANPMDILISVRAPVGAVNINQVQSCIGRGLSAIRASDNIDFKYLYYSLLTSEKILNSSAQGSTFTAINSGDLKNLKIKIPPLKEQEKIAEILSTVDSQIDDTEKLIEKSKELKKGLMQKLLTKGIGHSEFKKTEVGEIPFDWEIKTLESIASVIDSLHETPKYIDNGISMIRVVDINGGYIQTTKTVKVSDETYKKFTRKYTPRKGDIIMSRVGSYGLVSYLRDNNKVCLGQNIVVINTDINKKFLFYALSSQYIKNEIDKVTVGSSQKSLSLANIKKLHIVLPTSSEQVNISNILESIDKNIEEYINKLEELKYLKKGLMQQLLTGKIRVNNL